MSEIPFFLLPSKKVKNVPPNDGDVDFLMRYTFFLLKMQMDFFFCPGNRCKVCRSLYILWKGLPPKVLYINSFYFVKVRTSLILAIPLKKK